ncbi:MAG: methyltransferase [Candidatus Heimdallarchaeota archaeon]|nr:methyltransferase [Candidatus Heimdallarchaeota archaeon]MCK5048811.1 methyltransferase [Candidatus Heimdallarchaeota archaeon]
MNQTKKIALGAGDTGKEELLEIQFNEPVYPPYEDSELLAKAVWMAPFYSKAIDIGTGSGIQSVVYSKKHRRTEVISIDISRNALNYAKKNAERNEVSKNCEFVRTSKLACLKGNKQPTIWFCNPPYLPPNEQIDPYLPKEEILTLVSGKTGFEFSLEIIEQFEERATIGDNLYLLTSSHSCPETFEQQLQKRGLIAEQVAKVHIFFETLQVQKISKSEKNETD